MGPNHLLRLETGENEGELDDQLPDAYLFRIEAIPYYLEEIVGLLITGHSLEGYTPTQKRHLVVRVADYQLITGHLHQMGLDQVLRHCILPH